MANNQELAMQDVEMLKTGTRLLLEYENELKIALAYTDQLIEDIGHNRVRFQTVGGLKLAIDSVRNTGLHAFLLQFIELRAGGRV